MIVTDRTLLDGFRIGGHVPLHEVLGVDDVRLAVEAKKRERIRLEPVRQLTCSENPRVGTFGVVSICPISDPEQKTIEPSCASVIPAASRWRRAITERSHKTTSRHQGCGKPNQYKHA